MIKKGKFRELYLKYQNNKDFKNQMEKFKEGYYYRNNDCGECLQCLGGLVCADTLCECAGGDLCSWF